MSDEKYYTSFDEMMIKLKEPKPMLTLIMWKIEAFYDDWIKPSSYINRFNHYMKWVKWGFNPKDIWALDHTTSQWIIPRLKRLSEVKHGVPSMMYGALEEKGIFLERDTDESYNAMRIEWKNILNKMILAFELVIEDDILNKENENKIEEGLQLFAKYFRCLWD